MAEGERLVDELAGSVLDGLEVDWASAESSADPDARPLLRHLGLVASVARVYRDALPAEQWGHLRLVERIGQGGFGEVFRAWDTRLDREVALKLLPTPPAGEPKVESSFIREGRLLAKVDHPNVVTIYGADRIGDSIGLWMEFVRGRTLEQQLAQGTTFRADEIVEIGVGLCRAVSAVHAAGLLHRDIKAQNVMRAEDGRVVLMDFGAGRELSDNSASELAGTPLYVAPEVLGGSAPSVQSDIYSLGVLLYHLATKSYPVRGRTVRDIRDAHQRGERVVIRRARPGLRLPLARVIERACDLRPERRFSSADALAQALCALQPRPAVTAVRYALGAGAAVVLIVLLSEAGARLTGQQPSLGRRLAAALVGTASPLEHPVIAVLPFQNAGDDTSSGLLVDSVTTGLIRQLAVVDGLQVRSQASSFAFRDKPLSLADVGQRLSVNLVIKGDARVSGGGLRIRAALLSVSNGATVWSDQFDRQLRSEADIVGLTEEVTRTIVNALRLKLGPTQRRYETTDVATLQTYLKARALRDARGPGARASIPLFEEVVRADPAYAPAKAALAAVYGFLASQHPVVGGVSIPPAEAVQLMDPLVRGALDIDPMLAEARAAEGHLHALALRWRDAEASFRRAMQLEPNLTSVHGDFVISTLLPWGRVDEALESLKKALEADPLSLDLRRVLAFVQLQAGLYEEARDNARRVLAEDPAFPNAGDHLRWALLFNGEQGEALDLFEKFSSPSRPGVRGYVHAINGRRAEAEAIAAQFAHLPQRQAEIYGLLGDKDRALEALERLAAINPIRAATYLDSPTIGLRGDSRATAFRRKLRLPQ